MSIPLYSLLLQGIPELIAVVTLASIIARIPIKWTSIIPMGIFLALIVYIARLLQIPFGLHTLIIIIVLFLFLFSLNKGDLSLSLIATLMSFLALLIFELVSIVTITIIFKVSKETLFNDPILRIVSGEPQVILLYITALLLSKRRKKRSTHD